LAVEWVNDGRNRVSFVIDVNSYADLENVAEAIYKTLHSIGRIISEGYRAPHSGGRIDFPSPQIVVQHSNGARVASFRFWPVGGRTDPTQDEINRLRGIDMLYVGYLNGIRRGEIEEELSSEIWWKSPQNIYNIYFDGEMIRGSRDHDYVNYINRHMPYFSYNRSLKEYVAWLFSDRSILAWYVDKMGGSYEFNRLEATWTIGEDNWAATLYREMTYLQPFYPVQTSHRALVTKVERVTKNGENFDIGGDNMTLPVIARMLDLTFEVDQVTEAIYLWSCSDK